MQPQETIQRQTPGRDMFHAKVRLLGRDSDTRRAELRRTREAIARRTDHPDLLQLAETMKAVGQDLGQKRAIAAMLKALLQKFPEDYATVLEVWRTTQQVIQEMDKDPSSGD